MIYLSNFKKIKNPQVMKYPLSTGLISNLSEINFEFPVTILCGDNGCGKTTFMELLASCTNAIRIDTNFHENDKITAIQSAQSYFRVVFSRRPSSTFFFQAEAFIKYIDELEQMKLDAKKAIEQIDIDYAEKSAYARSLAKEPHYDTLDSISRMYANELSKRSHGEGFLDFFSSRLKKNGLYLLDEPEAALSYENQFVLSMLIKEALDMECQFVIATHSPVITAIPEAKIYEIVKGSFYNSEYEDIDNVRFLKQFLSDPKRFFRG